MSQGIDRKVKGEKKKKKEKDRGRKKEKKNHFWKRRRRKMRRGRWGGREGGRREGRRERGRIGRKGESPTGHIPSPLFLLPTTPLPTPLEEEEILAALMCKDLSPGTSIPSSINEGGELILVV